jgi:pyruvate dehydrogenase E1 component beta subunit
MSATDTLPTDTSARAASPTHATTTMTGREAMRAAMREAMLADERVFLMGEDVGRYGGCFAVSAGMYEDFGPERIRDTPLSESSFVGAGIGAAMGGMRPIVEIMTVNFSLLALDQIMNNAATLRHMSGGQVDVPLVIRMTTGGGRQLAAQHSHSLDGWYAHIPGLRIVAPGTIEDFRWMLAPALAEPDPVIIFENGALYGVSAEVPDTDPGLPLDRAVVRRPGRDVTLITFGGTLPTCLAAADELAADGVEAEVIDLRSLRPLDDATLAESVIRTHRAVVVDEGWRSGGISGEIAARLGELAFYELDAPVGRVCTAEVPLPYPAHLEQAALPSVERIVDGARAAMRGEIDEVDRERTVTP